MFNRLTSALALTAFAFGVTAPLAAAPAAADELFVQPAFQIAQEDPTFERPGHMRAFVLSFNRFNMTAGVRGREIPVVLHQGTIIRPTGLTLRPHMLVRIDGVFAGGAFQADRIVLVR